VANAAKHDDEEQFAAVVPLIALISASTRLWSSPASPAAATSPASSDNEDSAVWKECHEFSA